RQYGKEEGDGGQSLFSSRQRHEMLQFLPGGLHVDFETGFEGIVRIAELETCLAAAEKSLKSVGERASQFGVRRLKFFLALPIDTGDELQQVRTGLFEVVFLPFEKIVALLLLLKLD